MFVVVAVVFVVVVGGGGGGTCVCRADGAIPGLACAETRVLARSSPGLEFAFVCVCVFSHRFLLRFIKNCATWQATLYKKKLSCPFRVGFFGVFYVFRVSHGFCGVCADSRFLHMPA